MTEPPRPSSPSSSPRTSFTDNNNANLNKDNNNPPGVANLRHRGPSHAATFAEGSTSPSNLRRNSTLSDSVSEARNSIRSSTDDLFLPRVSKRDDVDMQDESNWQSAPLGLALLPAIAGVFFQNGSAVTTDITLLVLAAIFLNWSVRLPWDWYRSAQAVRQQDKYYDAADVQAEPESDDDHTATPGEAKKDTQHASAAASAASKELLIHELAALASCFIFPMIGTWLLHTIRSKLSRPSEGLVSNYNLTIFLLAAEIRPFAHLLRMVQARTLHLQRTVSQSSNADHTSTIVDLTKRLEELETHVAEAAAARLSSSETKKNQDQDNPEQDKHLQTLISQATTEIRKGFQPEIDALNRAVRRYEKRTAVSSFETNNRFQELETQVQDAVSLAAAVQRSGHHHRRRGFAFLLLDSVYALMLAPIQIFLSLANLPFRVVTRCLDYFKALVIRTPSSPTTKRGKGKMPQSRISPSPRRLKKVSQQPSDGSSLKTIREYS